MFFLVRPSVRFLRPIPWWLCRLPLARTSATRSARRRWPSSEGVLQQLSPRVSRATAHKGLPIVVNLVVLDTDLASRLRLLLEPSWSAWGRVEASIELLRRFACLLVSYL